MSMRKQLGEQSISVFIDSMDMYAFYRETAEILGMKVTGQDSFDCTKICISETILKKWEEQFAEKYGRDRMPELMRYLCLVGPKTDLKLGQDEVEVQNGFLVKENEQESFKKML